MWSDLHAPDRLERRSSTASAIPTRVVQPGRVLLIVLTLLLGACVSVPKPQAFNRAAYPDIQNIAVVPMPEIEVDVTMMNHPGMNFGLVGGLIALGDLAAKRSDVQEITEAAGFDPMQLFRDELDATLRERGYTPTWAVNWREERAGTKAAARAALDRSVAANPTSHAHLQVTMNFVGYAAAGAGDAQPYRPTVAISAELLDAGGQVVLFRDQIYYHNVIGSQTAIILEPSPDHVYPDFGALKQGGPRIVEGLRDAVRESARKLGAQL